MTDIRFLIPDRERPDAASIDGAWYAVFANSPALADPAYVIIPDIDLDSTWGPCRWEPRVVPYVADVSEPAQVAHVGGAAETAHLVTTAQVLLPVAGNSCLVLFDNRLDLWVVSWTP